MRRVEVGEFTMMVNGDVACPVNPLNTHGIFADKNMESIAEMIPIVISRNPSVVENVFVGAYCSHE
jgi:hypothetical protein